METDGRDEELLNLPCGAAAAAGIVAFCEAPAQQDCCFRPHEIFELRIGWGLILYVQKSSSAMQYMYNFACCIFVPKFRE